MPILLAPILTWLASFFGKFLTDSLLKFAAYKLLLYTLLTVTLPIILKNFVGWLFDTLSAIVLANVDITNLQSTSLQLTGLGGYLAQQLLIPDCISIILTACAIKFTLRLIPFVG